MPRWLPRVLARIRELAVERRILFTLKARRELAALDLGLDEDDACDLLARLTADDWATRFRSAATGEWMYVFKPKLDETVLYVKLIVRDGCIIVSFHEDDIQDQSQGENQDDNR